MLDDGEFEEIAEDTSDSDEIGDEDVDAEQILEALQGEIPIEVVAPEAPNEPNTITGYIVFLSAISNDPEIEKDARFLDEMQKLLNSYQTSVPFTSSRNQMEVAYQSARRGLKKRIKNSK